MCNYQVQGLFLFNFVASSQDALGHVWKNVSTVAKQSLVPGGGPLMLSGVPPWPGPGGSQWGGVWGARVLTPALLLTGYVTLCHGTSHGLSFLFYTIEEEEMRWLQSFLLPYIYSKSLFIGSLLLRAQKREVIRQRKLAA